MREWVVIQRNVCICKKCNGGMAIWQNIRTKNYLLSCDYCNNEIEYAQEDVENMNCGYKLPKLKEVEE